MASASSTTKGNGSPLILLDGMSLAFRAYFALPPDLATSAGVVTNAVHGFASMLVNLVRDHRPSGLAVAFDLPGGTFRDDVVDDYKGGRAETPADLVAQFDMIRALLGSLAIPVVEAVGYEADDVLATLATEARDRSQPVIIVTGDRDAYQLVEDPFIRVLYNRRGVSDYVLYDELGIEERTGVRPPKYPLLAALRGDPSDNLPGVPGVGENLAAYVDRVRKNAEVIPLIRNVPLEISVDELELGGWDTEVARAMFAELELRTIWTRFQTVMNDGLLGPPLAGGSAGAEVVGQKPGGGAGPVEDQPAWLVAPDLMVPDDAASAVVGLDAIVTLARSGTGNLALFAQWTGDPGRSSLRDLALTPESGPIETHPVLYLRGGGGSPVLEDPTVMSALAVAFGEGGLGLSLIHI